MTRRWSAVRGLTEALEWPRAVGTLGVDGHAPGYLAKYVNLG